jgi:hypothetical protein
LGENSHYNVRTPMTAEELAVYAAFVRANAAAFDGVREARGRPRVEWNVDLGPSPVLLNADMKFLNEQRGLAELVVAAALHAHETGDDAAALDKAADLLFISRAVDQQPMLIPHLVSIGISAMACDVLAQVAPELRVDARPGSMSSAVSATPPRGPDGTLQPPRPAARSKVAALIADLLNEAPLVASRQRMMLGERMSMVDAARAIADGKLSITDLGGTAIPGGGRGPARRSRGTRSGRWPWPTPSSWPGTRPTCGTRWPPPTTRRSRRACRRRPNRS